MADLKNLEGMIDSTPIMKDYADIESSKLPEYQIDSKIPEGPIAEKWTNYKAHQKLVNPANKRHLDIIVVGTGLAGASAASTLGEPGFNVYNFCMQDSPRRAHSIAAQGGINALLPQRAGNVAFQLGIGENIVHNVAAQHIIARIVVIHAKVLQPVGGGVVVIRIKLAYRADGRGNAVTVAIGIARKKEHRTA